MIATRQDWINVLQKTGVKFETTKKHVVFVVKAFMWKDNRKGQLITVGFDSIGNFESIESTDTDTKALDLLNPKARINDWKELLAASKIRSSYEQSCHRWGCTHWLEFHCKDLAIQIHYDSDTSKVYDLDIEGPYPG